MSEFDSTSFSARARLFLTDRGALKIAAIYAVFGSLWVLVSDTLVFTVATDPDRLNRLQHLKGLAYVTGSSLIVYLLARTAIRSILARTELARQLESRRATDMLMDYLGDVILAHAPEEDRVLHANAALTPVLGYTPEEIAGGSLGILFAGREEHAAFQANIANSLEGDPPLRFAAELVRKDGGRVLAEITAVPTRPVLESERGLLYIVRDVTAHAESLARLRESEEKHRLLAEQSMDTIWSMDLDGTIRYVNPAIRDLIGYGPEEVTGRNFREFKTTTGENTVEKGIQRLLDTSNGDTSMVVRAEALHRSGEAVPIEVHCSLQTDEAGRPSGLQGTTRDLRLRNALEAQLRQAQKMEAVGTLASGIAHEVNNPVMVISGYAELLRHSPDADGQARELAARIESETRRIQAIVENLLGFARKDDQRTPTYLSVEDVLQSSIDLITASLRHDGIDLKVEIESGLPGVEGFPFQIQQVVLNLLTNARDALNEKYRDPHQDKIIRLTARQVELDRKSWVEIEVEDHGIGLSAESERHMYEPFFTTKPAGVGTGLGLWIIQQIIREHHGLISVESEPGTHTRFRIRLPAAFAPAEKTILYRGVEQAGRT